MDRARELQQARRLEMELNEALLNHDTHCQHCDDGSEPHELRYRTCPSLARLTDQADYVADAIEYLEATS